MRPHPFDENDAIVELSCRRSIAFDVFQYGIYQSMLDVKESLIK